MGDVNLKDNFTKFLSIYCNSLTANLVPHVCFTAGSVVELPLYYFLMNSSDTDSMFSPVNIYATSMKNWKDNHKRTKHTGATILYIDTSNSYPGFARLRYGTGELHPHTELGLHGPAKVVGLEITLRNSGLYKFFGPAIEHSVHQASKVTRDVVHAIFCPVWPYEAMEWKTRKRSGGWPGKDLVKRIVSCGCHFVQKPHDSHPEDCTEWRFSFSMAELILIKSWTSHQKYVYHLLRIIKKQTQWHSNSTELCTYYIETLMLWALEEHDQTFWDTVSTSAAIEMMLAMLIESLIDRRCPNYFMPSNNMLDHIDDSSSFDCEIEFLHSLVVSRIDRLQSINPVFCANCKVYLSFPSTLVPLLNGALNLPLFPQSEFERPKCKIMLNKIFEKELRHVAKGINYQVLSMKSKLFQIEGETTTFVGRNFQLAEEHFCKGMSSKTTLFSADLYMKHMPCEVLIELCKKIIRPTIMSSNLLQYKTLVYQQKSASQEVMCECSYTQFLQILVNTFNGIASGSLPKISYFTCTAFATNFYLKIGNYKLAVDVSTKALDLFKPISVIELYEYNAPVLMVEEWSVVFDNQIQTILGFFILVKHHLQLQTFVLDRICPVLFLHYLRVQCCWRTRDVEFEKLSTYLDFFKQHHVSCFQEKYCRLNRSQILTCALRLSGIFSPQLPKS